MEKKRIEFIDLAKGFCIILVLINHVNSMYTFCQIGSIFRMPLYFFLSGLFFKTYSGFGEFLFRKCNRLFVPFLFFFAMGALLNYCFLGWELCIDEYISNEYIKANPAIWFLLSLFEVNIISFALVKLSKEKTLVMLLLFFLTGILGLALGHYGCNLYLYIDTSLTCTPFFFMGYLFRKKTNLLNKNSYDKFWLPIAIICFSTVVSVYMHYQEYIDLRINKVPYHTIAFYTTSMIGIIGILIIAKRIGHIPFISYIGKYSIVILGMHFFFNEFFRQFLNPYFGSFNPISDIILFVIVLILSSAAIPILCKFTPKFIAQEDLIKMPQKKA